MTSTPGIIGKIRQLSPNLTICARIAIGNSAIIIASAFAGTAVTHLITEKGEELIFLLLVALVGLSLSLVLNYIIIRSALQPLQEMHDYALKIGSGKAPRQPPQYKNPDPETCQVTSTIGGLVEQLETNNRQLRATSRRAIHAQEEERKRIAGWLHDDTGQALITLILKLEKLENLQPEENEDTRTRLAEARLLAAQALKSLREVITGLRPSILDDLGLVSAVRWYARSNLEGAGIRADFQAEEITLEIPPELTTTLLRVAQESINNIVRHSQAKNANITLAQRDQGIYLRIEDDGQGFSTASEPLDATEKQHWGLIGIRERLSLVGGSLTLTSAPQQGTLLEVFLPLPKVEEVVNG
jgi:signal transduction histidine kinase